MVPFYFNSTFWNARGGKGWLWKLFSFVIIVFYTITCNKLWFLFLMKLFFRESNHGKPPQLNSKRFTGKYQVRFGKALLLPLVLHAKIAFGHLFLQVHWFFLIGDVCRIFWESNISYPLIRTYVFGKFCVRTKWMKLETWSSFLKYYSLMYFFYSEQHTLLFGGGSANRGKFA